MSDKPLWQTLLKSVLETEEHEITCEDCFNALDLYADHIFEGADPAEIMPTVKQHLSQCHCCEAELEAMMIIIKEAATPAN